MIFGKREKGYTPWTYRKAPMFNTSLNTTYIKLSGAFLLALTCFVTGIAVAPSLTKNNLVLRHINQEPIVVEQKTKAIYKPTPIAPPAAAIAVVDTNNELIVPAIPMVSQHLASSTKISVEDMLKRDYGVSTYDALILIAGAKEASVKTGIDPSLLLALAAKTTNFKMFDGKNFIGVMNVNPDNHPSEVKKLALDKITYMTISGSFRLGAEVLLTSLSQNNGDMSVAITKFATSNKSGNQPTLAEIMELKKQFDGV